LHGILTWSDRVGQKDFRKSDSKTKRKRIFAKQFILLPETFIDREGTTISIMVYNILNGDSLAYSFSDAKIDGEIVIAREALIDGDLSGNNLEEFWQARARYLGLSDIEYRARTVKEFEKILNAPGDAEFNLWFEYDLFCQINMWFVLSLINRLPAKKKVFAVYTTHLNKNNKQFWNCFGSAKTNELNICFDQRVQLNEKDQQFGDDLWTAYKNADLDALSRLSKNQSAAFPYIEEVIQAHIDRFPKDGEKGRPEKALEDITKNISTDFHKVFREFWNRESIYGFGDIQLKHLYDKVMRYR
jgi:hypothetical protein